MPTIADLYAAANAITAKYVQRGTRSALRSSPKQTIENGHAEIDVVEGYVAEFKFVGDTENIPPVLTDYAKHIVSSHPLKTAALERFLLLANDVPGYTAKSVFDRIEGAPRGATRLIIHLEHKAVSGYATVDNRGSKAMGPWRADIGATLNNLLGQGEALEPARVRLVRNKGAALRFGQSVVPARRQRHAACGGRDPLGFASRFTPACASRLCLRWDDGPHRRRASVDQVPGRKSADRLLCRRTMAEQRYFGGNPIRATISIR